MTTWMTVDEAAAYIRAGDARKIRAAIKSGALKGYLYGRRDLRVTAEDVDQWLKTREALDS